MIECLFAATMVAAGAPVRAPHSDPYRSVLSEYRPWRAELPRLDWRRANEEVRRLAGHAGHLRDPSPADDSRGSSESHLPPDGGPR